MTNVMLMVAAYFFMEFVAWSNHKFVMHGFLWSWHKDHHRKDSLKSLPLNTEAKKFEKNDLFFVVYALPAILFLFFGFIYQYIYLLFIGFGITLYGLTYFLIHDLIIHKRIKTKANAKSHNPILKAIIKAHTAHHAPKNKDDFNNFGLLFFSTKYFN